MFKKLASFAIGAALTAAVALPALAAQVPVRVRGFDIPQHMNPQGIMVDNELATVSATAMQAYLVAEQAASPTRKLYQTLVRGNMIFLFTAEASGAPMFWNNGATGSSL